MDLLVALGTSSAYIYSVYNGFIKKFVDGSPARSISKPLP
jgi:cation transport ATPase